MFTGEFNKCSHCGKSRWIVHGKLRLCQECNEGRKKDEKRIRPRIEKSGLSFTVRDKPTAGDENFYQMVWNIRSHCCQECGKFLGDQMSRIYVSHILTKGAHPALRHDIRNVNILCPEHHHQWEFGVRRKMHIFEKNEAIIELLKSEKYVKRTAEKQAGIEKSGEQPVHEV